MSIKEAEYVIIDEILPECFNVIKRVYESGIKMEV